MRVRLNIRSSLQMLIFFIQSKDMIFFSLSIFDVCAILFIRMNMRLFTFDLRVILVIQITSQLFKMHSKCCC